MLLMQVGPSGKGKLKFKIDPGDEGNEEDCDEDEDNFEEARCIAIAQSFS